jgi:hypothetical protein
MRAALLVLVLAVQGGQAAADQPGPRVRLEAARRAAFPHGIIVDDHGESRHFDEHRLVDAPFGPVLVSVGYVEMGAHSSPGVVAVYYLRSNGAGFAVRRAFPTAVENGSHGGLSDWSVSRRFTNLPAIYIEGGGTWQGYTCGVATLTELRPDGPVEIASIPINYDNAGVGREERASSRERLRRLEGEIVNIHRGASFDVRFTGTARFTEHYVYRGGRFVRAAGGDSRASC